MRKAEKNLHPGAATGLPSPEDVKKRYGEQSLADQLNRQMAVLEASFALVEKAAERLGEAYAPIEAAWLDAVAVYGSTRMADSEKQQTLYLVYDAYFGLLAHLPWAKRRACRADRSIRKMKQAVKRGGKLGTAAKFWLDFAKYALPPIVVGLAAELLYFDLLEAGAPWWQQLLCLAVFAAGFGVYFVACYELEGRRLLGGLQKWLDYRLNPQEHGRPLDILQTAKMAVPLVVALGSALIKLYFQ